VWIKVEAFWLICPAFAVELIGRQAFEGFQFSAINVGVDEVMDVSFELVVAVKMLALDGCLFDRTVHTL
jgi:hypothetical protein